MINTGLFLIACFSIFSLAFLTRIYLLLKYKWVGKDSFYNFLVAQEIRKKESYLILSINLWFPSDMIIRLYFIGFCRYLKINIIKNYNIYHQFLT